MNNDREELLIILMEECAEVTQEASKLIRFENNDYDRIEKEIGDVLCMIELMCKSDMIDASILMDHIEAKKEKLKHWSSLHIDSNVL